MRTKRQQLYDKLYYSIERQLSAFSTNRYTRRKFRRVKFDRDFYTAYKESILPYWAPYGVRPKIWWVKQTYERTGSLDPRYIPEDLYMRDITPYFNEMSFMRQLTDKNLHHLLFPDVKRPVTAFKHMSGLFRADDLTPISREEALAALAPDRRYIIKPTRNTAGGRDIRFFDGSDDPESIRKLLDSYDGIDYIVQELLTQHPVLASLNSTSVNTVRLVTLLLDEEPILLSSVLRVGAPGSRVDNVSSGGFQCVIQPDGTLSREAYAQRGNGHIFIDQLENGLRFEDITVPNFAAVTETALALAKRIPHFRLIAWDFSIDPDENIVLIEYNATRPGQNQENGGPTFGDLTEEVLTRVYGKKRG